jgi:hypothetical protein
MFAGPAWADGGDPLDEGYVIVQQALSYLVNDASAAGTTEALMNGTTEALMKVDEALAADDQDGVDVAVLREAKTALQAGDTAAGRELLQESITAAVTALAPATGEETGTTIVLGPLSDRAPFSITKWILLASSLVVAAVGVWLATLFRPRESLKELSRDILAGQELSSLSAIASNEGNHDVR